MAGKLVAWRIPKGAPYRLVRFEERNLCVEQKAPKPLTPHLALLERTNANLRRADQLASLKQGPPIVESVPTWARRQASDHGKQTFGCPL
jgi:hypothetical protein